jgi:addiction module RelE/StbE family toxin
MKIDYTKNFEKQYLKLPEKIQNKFKSRLRLFLLDPYAPQLRNHSLRGKYEGFYSINVTGDIRALYRIENEQIVLFSFIGTHSQLY